MVRPRPDDDPCSASTPAAGRRFGCGPCLWLSAVGASHLPGSWHGPIRIAGASFLLCNGSASSFVRRVAIAQVFEGIFTDSPGSVLWWWGARSDGRAPFALARFGLGRLTVADASPRDAASAPSGRTG
jgi:hypothetical protein